MEVTGNIKYTNRFDSRKRIFSDYNKLLKFFRKNKKNISNVRFDPPRLGSKNFGSVVVTTKR